MKPFAPSDNVLNLCLQEKLSILRCAPFKKNNKKPTKFLDIAYIKNDSCLAIPTIHCQPMRSPLYTYIHLYIYIYRKQSLAYRTFIVKRFPIWSKHFYLVSLSIRPAFFILCLFPPMVFYTMVFHT